MYPMKVCSVSRPEMGNTHSVKRFSQHPDLSQVCLADPQPSGLNVGMKAARRKPQKGAYDAINRHPILTGKYKI